MELVQSAITDSNALALLDLKVSLVKHGVVVHQTHVSMEGHVMKKMLDTHVLVEVDTKEIIAKTTFVIHHHAQTEELVMLKMDHLTAHALMDSLETNVNWQAHVQHSLA